MTSNWIVLLLPKLMKLAIMVTYMPANLDYLKLLQIMLFRKNCEFPISDRIMMDVYKITAS